MKYITVIALLFLMPNFSYCQRNLYDTDINRLNERDANVCWIFSMAEAAMSVGLKYVEDGTINIKGCRADKFPRPFPETIIAVRINKNLNFTVFYADIHDKNGVATDSAYVGYMKRQYGETKNYLIKVKKTRLYLENNIYTESITLNNGIFLTIENKLFVRKLKLPEYDEVTLNAYTLDDCSVESK